MIRSEEAYDLIALLSEQDKAILVKAESDGLFQSAWLKNATACRKGSFLVFTPAKLAGANMQVFSPEKIFPNVMISDLDANNSPDEIYVSDISKTGIVLSDRNNDGCIDSFSYTVNSDSNIIGWIDYDADGEFDLRAGPGDLIKVRIGDRFYKRIKQNERYLVETDNGWVEVVVTNNIWCFCTQ
jgi:hypothetical protein